MDLMAFLTFVGQISCSVGCGEEPIFWDCWLEVYGWYLKSIDLVLSLNLHFRSMEGDICTHPYSQLSSSGLLFCLLHRQDVRISHAQYIICHSIHHRWLPPPLPLPHSASIGSTNHHIPQESSSVQPVLSPRLASPPPNTIFISVDGNAPTHSDTSMESWASSCHRSIL